VVRAVSGAGLAQLGDWLVGPGDGPIGPSPRVMNNIYIYREREREIMHLSTSHAISFNP
jgi:hypothetical protein